ncbi:tRNA-guanine transglycosylase [uncultured Limosilactobacillus sp.]|uniref:tRNA-guanine transglycosylase n=1 Tax=uncultured Limosilactobacillus sp. TaxID=2837629 RepID=UPI0025D84797|nr:tRNA-guanine transglycosylase [uncultured Limosilactobacillus sp.]
MENQFKIEPQSLVMKSLRRGKLTTAHGVIQTPAVIPFAKRGMVSPLTMAELMKVGCQGLAVSALPLMVHPGENVIKMLGSFHNFLQWERPLLSTIADFDEMKKVKKNAGELGIRYEEPYTRAHLRLTAEQAMTIQTNGQADVQLPMYQTPSYYAPVDDLKMALDLNLQWQKQANSEWGIVVGAGLKSLRQDCIKLLDHKNGYLIANLPNDRDEWRRIVKEVCSLLPPQSLRMLIAVDYWQIQEALSLGIDIVISAAPIEDAHRGEVYSATGLDKISYEQFRSSSKKMTTGVGQRVTYAYLHYLHLQHNPLGDHYLGLNNWWWINQLTGELRRAIQNEQPQTIEKLFQLALTNDKPVRR